jgi:hypothetical protein
VIGFGSIRRPRRNLLCFFAKVLEYDNFSLSYQSLICAIATN